MRERAAGAHRSCHERSFRQFLLGHAMRAGMPAVDIDAVGALGRERDTERNQFAVFARDRGPGRLAALEILKDFKGSHVKGAA